MGIVLTYNCTVFKLSSLHEIYRSIPRNLYHPDTAIIRAMNHASRTDWLEPIDVHVFHGVSTKYTCTTHFDESSGVADINETELFRSHIICLY